MTDKLGVAMTGDRWAATVAFLEGSITLQQTRGSQYDHFDRALIALALILA